MNPGLQALRMPHWEDFYIQGRGMRTFISCPIDKQLEAYLQKLCLALPEGKFIVPKQFDLTIKFLGEISDETMAAIREKLQHLRIAPFEASLQAGVSVFSERHIRTVWVGVEPAASFIALHAQVEEALVALVPLDDRYVPHITLARVKSLRDKKKFLDQLHSMSVEPHSMQVDRLVLVKSELTQSGAVHTPLCETAQEGI